ncbi:MAG: HAMP domain-containing histidine kinase [Spirochaetaceae bacterium]|nr:HAMP domain-containing histidine kinase [Spirochaetaceae bacterium]
MRRQLALLVAATTSVVLLAFLLPLAVLVSRVASSSAVSEATTRSQAVVSAVASGADARELAAVIRPLERSGLRVAVGAPGAVTLRETTVSRTADGHALLRQPVVTSGGEIVVETLVPHTLLREGVHRAWLVLGLLGVLLVSLSLVVADRLARSITRPITQLAAAAERLAGGDLTSRVEPSGPLEVREVGAAINQLAGRIGELLATERESAADLSHRLRTPITALRLDVDALPAGVDRDRLGGAVNELTRQVDRLIREARRPVREGVEARSDARAVVTERVAFWQPLAEDQGRPVTLHLPPHPCLVRTTPQDLETALDALLGNVIAHTPEGTALTVAVGRDGHDGVLVVVSDDGPGFADEGVVGRGQSRAGSTGLGLDIARRTATASGGDLRISSSPGGGARVSMRLGPPAAARRAPAAGPVQP